MSAWTFVANFFREGTAESSTRLVGIGSFLTATALAVYMVSSAKVGPGEIATLALTFTNACIALGLRKRNADDATPSAP